MIRIVPKLLLALVALSTVVTAQSVPTAKDDTIAGAGFTFTLPHNLLADIAATPETLHGFYIALPPRYGPKDELTLSRTETREPGYRYIAFDTKWDTGDMPSLGAAVDNITSNVLDHIPADLVGDGPVMLEGNMPARLGTLPARRLILSYKNSERKAAIRQVIIAYRTRKDAAAVVYFLTLNTTRDSFQDDIEVFGKVLAGFKLSDQ